MGEQKHNGEPEPVAPKRSALSGETQC